MKKRNCVHFLLSASLLLLFILYTVATLLIDVKPIGPQHSLVGFASLNQWVHHLFGVHLWLYTLTDWLSLLTLLPVLGFVVLGFIQLIQRKSLFRVDSSLLVLGGFYLLVLAAYLFFEWNVINYRPILIHGSLEASYPSSTTMLVMCVVPTALLQFCRLLQNKFAKNCTLLLGGAFTAFMVVGRLVSGVHWFTDILGGILLSAALVMLYYSVNGWLDAKHAPQNPR